MLGASGTLSMLIAARLWGLDAQELSIAWGLYSALALVWAGLVAVGGP